MDIQINAHKNELVNRGQLKERMAIRRKAHETISNSDDK